MNSTSSLAIRSDFHNYYQNQCHPTTIWQHGCCEKLPNCADDNNFGPKSPDQNSLLENLERMLVNGRYGFGAVVDNVRNCGNPIISTEFGDQADSGRTSRIDAHSSTSRPKIAPSTKDRKKKEVHNMIERRRRYNINDRIKEIGALLPKSWARQTKPYKGSILRTTVEYLKAVQQRKDKYAKLKASYRALLLTNKALVKNLRNFHQNSPPNGSSMYKNWLSDDSLIPHHVIMITENGSSIEDNETATETIDPSFFDHQLDSDSSYSSDSNSERQSPAPTQMDNIDQ